MKQFMVSTTVVLSVQTIVEADNKQDAIEKGILEFQDLEDFEYQNLICGLSEDIDNDSVSVDEIEE